MKSHLSHLKVYTHAHTDEETRIAMILKYGVAFSPMPDFLFDNKLETSRRIIFILYITVTAIITTVVILIFSYIVERELGTLPSAPPPPPPQKRESFYVAFTVY